MHTQKGVCLSLPQDRRSTVRDTLHTASLKPPSLTDAGQYGMSRTEHSDSYLHRPVPDATKYGPANIGSAVLLKASVVMLPLTRRDLTTPSISSRPKRIENERVSNPGLLSGPWCQEHHDHNISQCAVLKLVTLHLEQSVEASDAAEPLALSLAVYWTDIIASEGWRRPSIYLHACISM